LKLDCIKQTDLSSAIPENRPLSAYERELLSWLLQNAAADNSRFLEQLDAARVVSRCGCGCATINLSVGDGGWHSSGGLPTLAGRQWTDNAGRLFGVVVFAKAGLLAGLEVYSVDGEATPTKLPPISADWV
jgi:hypothetical protein